MMKYLQRFLLIVLVIALAITGGFFAWALTPSQPGAAALAALQSDDVVTVTDYDNYITFEPIGKTASTGFLFYPGGHVDYRAYAPILHRIAAQGYFVVLLRVRLSLAFFDIDAGDAALQAFPQITTWVTGGHSLGGVASAFFAEKHPEIKALIFWASYPANDKLKNTGVKMISIYGTEDGGLDHGRVIEKNKILQPVDTQFIVLQGANHGQFGDYGPQPGDRPATITAEEQWQQVTDATVSFLQSLTP